MSVRKGSKIIAGAYAVIKPDVYVKTEVDDLLDKKQDKLIAGTNIFIGDDNVISATGGSGGYINVVQETGDSTDDVMSQASVTHELEQKVNTLDLADIAFTSDYNDLSNTPDLATYTKTEDLAEVALTGDYDDLGNTPDLTLYAKTEDLSKVAVSNNYEDLDDKPNLNMYDTVVSVNNKLLFKQDNLKAGYGISIEDNTISNTVDTVEWGKIIGDINTQEDLQGEFIAIRNTIKDSDDNSLNKTQVTNCILEVPQKIKLELNDGLLTLKAGSQVIVPNGFEDDGVTPKFDEVTVESDTNISATGGSGACLICVGITSAGISFGASSMVDNCVSGNGVTPINYGMCYDTAKNIVQRWGNGELSIELASLPLALTTQTDGTITSINQTFNGLGYIGSTVWVDKGVKGLIPNGRNEDGTLRNIEFTIENLLTYTLPPSEAIRTNNSICYDVTEGHSPLSFFTTNYGADSISSDGFIYNPSGEKRLVCELATASFDKTSISNFNPKLSFRAIDYQDVNTIINSSLTECVAITQTYQNGSSWYRVYSDGWCEQGGYCSGNANVTFLKPFINTNYSLVGGLIGGTTTATYEHMNFNSQTTTGFSFVTYDSYKVKWVASGYIR